MSILVQASVEYERLSGCFTRNRGIVNSDKHWSRRNVVQLERPVHSFYRATLR